MNERDSARISPLEELKRAWLPVVDDAGIRQLETVIREAQTSPPPKDKLSFVRDIRRLLAAGGLEIREVGSDQALTLSLKNGSIAVAGKRSGTSGFRDKSLVVVKAQEPTFAPNPKAGGPA